MKEKLFKIVEWTRIKLKVNQRSVEKIYFYSREIWWANIGSNIGFEQDGKNFNFSRPILVLKKFNKNMFWGLPLTSKNKIGDYFYSIYRKDENYTFILSQLKLISSKRLIRKINKISIEDFEIIKNKINKFL